MSTAALLVEAVDTVRALGWALRVWTVLMAVVVTVAAYTVVAAVAWPCNTARDALDAALSASRAVLALPEHQAAHETRADRPGPSWARTEQDAA